MVDFDKLKQLREETGISYDLCKKALEEAGDDIEKAKKVLEKIAGKKIEEKTKRTTKSGGIFSYVHHNRLIASMVEVVCETDFVSGNKEFQDFGYEIAMQVASLKPKNVKELMDQDFIKDPKKKIKDLLNEAVLKFGEKIEVSRISIWSLGEKKNG
jgi:elongation factor Ts